MMLERECLICGKSFKGQNSGGRPPVVCSRACHLVRQRDMYNVRDTKKACEVCGSSYMVSKYKAHASKYCSRGCVYKANTKQGSVIVACVVCGKENRRNPSDSKTLVPTCSYKCMGIAKTKTVPTSGKFAAVRKWFSRKNRMKECVRCGYDEIPGILVLHHKDRNRDNNDLGNLEVLCPNCHAAEHLKENKTGWNHESKAKAYLRRLEALKKEREINAAL